MDQRKKATVEANKILPSAPKHFVAAGFIKKRSFNYDMTKTEVFLNRPSSSKGWKWVAYFIVGVFIGVTAFVMSKFEEWLLDKRIELAHSVIDSPDVPGTDKGDKNVWGAWSSLAAWVFISGAVGTTMTIYIGPGANGSGIAELMAYLNGVNYPGMIGYKVLFIKTLCVILGISGALCIGKEGPLAHIGAIIALAVIYLFPLQPFEYFRNDEQKREFVCAGISAGVSAAFASPIGGALFSYEMSKPNTFWTFAMIWRTFFCSSISTFTLSILDQLVEGDELKVNAAGTVKFGRLADVSVPLTEVVGSLVLGVVGGVLGSFFITVNGFMGRQRKRFINTNWKKIIETGIFGVMTISAMTLMIHWAGKCRPMPPRPDPETQKEAYGLWKQVNHIHWNCVEDEEYNDLATLFYNTEAAQIKSLFYVNGYFTIDTHQIFLFGFTWYVFTIFTYGVVIPAGLFLPGIIMGGALGRWYTALI